MSRKYLKDSMLKSKGILYFPPVETFAEAFEILKECGGAIISLEEDGFLVDETEKLLKLYNLKLDDLEIYFIDVLRSNNINDTDISEIIDIWKNENLI